MLPLSSYDMQFLCLESAILHLTIDYKRSLGQEIDFTDDTAMTRSVAASLIEKKGIDLKDMAHRFVSLNQYYLCNASLPCS